MDKRAIAKEQQRSRYYRAGSAIVRKALRTYSKEFEDDIRKATSLQQMKAIAERKLRTDSIEKAMKLIWVPVSKHFGEQTFRAIMPAEKSLKFEPNVQGLVRPTNIGGTPRSVIGLTPKPPLPGMVSPVTTDYWFAWVEKLIKGSLGQRITWITETTRETFISVIDRIAYAGFESGKGIPEIAREIMKDLNITEKYRAERIARTEVISSSNLSSQAGAQATGLELDKEWISYIDDKTRDSHRDLNGAKVDINETFSNGLEVPGDPAGEAEEVINCRCTVGYAAKEGAEYSWGREI